MLLNLPEEIISEVLIQLQCHSVKELLHLRIICKRFKAIITEKFFLLYSPCMPPPSILKHNENFWKVARQVEKDALIHRFETGNIRSKPNNEKLLEV